MPSRQFDMAAFATALRSRVSVQDGFILAAALCATALFAFEFDFFENLDHMTAREKRISVQESFALAGLLIVGLIVFSFRRLQQLKHELARRIVAETAAQAALQEAMSDPLTGLPNRRALMRAISAALAGPREPSTPHGLVLLDLTGFKSINDRFGHPVGDRILQHLGRRMQLIAASEGIVARLGGDEFAVFCCGLARPDDADELAHRLVVGIEEPIEVDGFSHRVRAGAGIALFPQDATSVQELISRADAALYHAKAEKQSAIRRYR